MGLSERYRVKGGNKVLQDNDRLYNLINAQLRHSIARKAEFWGRDVEKWKWYDSQEDCCRQLLIDYKKPYTGSNT